MYLVSKGFCKAIVLVLLIVALPATAQEETKSFNVATLKESHEMDPEGSEKFFKPYLLGIRDGWSIHKSLQLVDTTKGETKDTSGFEEMWKASIQECIGKYSSNIYFSVVGAPADRDELLISIHMWGMLDWCFNDATDARIKALNN